MHKKSKITPSSRKQYTFKRVSENLYKVIETGGYYALVKRGGKQIRRSLKTKDKFYCRLSCMLYTISRIPYLKREDFKPLDGTMISRKYRLDLNGVAFNNLTHRQFVVLDRLKTECKNRMQNIMLWIIIVCTIVTFPFLKWQTKLVFSERRKTWNDVQWKLKLCFSKGWIH